MTDLTPHLRRLVPGARMRCAWMAGGLWLSLVAAAPGWAALGASEASVSVDQQALGASRRSALLTGCTVHTLTQPNGLTVRQFVDSTGTVFAIAWEGPVLPHFELLLAAYYPAYLEAQRTQRRGVQVHDSALVIESGGMMRSFVGRAYLPGKLPSGLSPEVIR